MFIHRIGRAALVAPCLALLACGTSSSTSEDGPTGTASLAIAVVPSNVTCVQIDAVGATTLTQNFAVAANGSSVLTMTGLPTGTVAFHAYAYLLGTSGTATCTGLTTSTVPTWLSNTVTATVSSTSTVALTLEMTQNGQGVITVDFPDAGGPDATSDAAADAPVTPTPTIAITSPTGGGYASSAPIAVQVNVTGQIPSSVDLLVDGAIYTSLASPFEYTLNPSSLTAGAHSLVANGHFGATMIASLPVTLNVDHTAPTIAAHTPAASATNVKVTDPITVTFSEPILSSTISGSAFTLLDNGTPVAFTPSLSTDGKTLTITPIAPTDGGSTLTLSFTSAVTDLAGNGLTGTLTWSWVPPQWLTYAAPTFPAFPYTVSTMLGVQLFSPSWQLGNGGFAIFDLIPETGAQLLYVQNAGVWTSLSAPAAAAPPSSFPAANLGYDYGLASSGALIEQAIDYNSAATTGAGQSWESDATWSGTAWGAWVQNTTNYDSTYGYYQLDSSGNAYAEVGTTTGVSVYKRTGTVWALWTTITNVSSADSYYQLSPSGTLYLFRTPVGASGALGTGAITLTAFNGVSWTTIVSASNPVNAAAFVYCGGLLDPVGTPDLACYFPTGTANAAGYYAATDAYLLTPSGNTWAVVGGGPMGPKGAVGPTGSTPAVEFDRFGRTRVLLTATNDGVTGTYDVVDLAGGKWQTPIVVPSPFSTTDTTDVGFSTGAGTDMSNNPAWVEMHGHVVGSGTTATLTPTATVHLLNR